MEKGGSSQMHRHAAPFQCLYYIEKMAKKPSSKLHKYLQQRGGVSCSVWIKMYQMRHNGAKKGRGMHKMAGKVQETLQESCSICMKNGAGREGKLVL